MHICTVVIPADPKAKSIVIIPEANMKENERIYREEMQHVLSAENYERWLASRQAHLRRRVPGWLILLLVGALFAAVALCAKGIP